jgi:hypothetical protein
LNSTQDNTLLGAWTTYSNVVTLKNIAVLGGDNGVQAVHSAATDDLQQIFSEREKQVQDHLGSAMGDYFRECVGEVLSL